MQVILKKDIPELGRMGTMVKVRDGYARNFLIPRSLAVAANPRNLAELEHQKKLIELHKKVVQKESETVASKLKDVSIVVSRRFNESGKMFGSLTSTDLAAELAKKGFTVDRRDIELEAVKNAGSYDVKVRLPGDVYVTVKLTLEASATEDAKAKSKAKKRKTKEAKGDEESAETSAVETEIADTATEQ